MENEHQVEGIEFYVYAMKPNTAIKKAHRFVRTKHKKTLIRILVLNRVTSERGKWYVRGLMRHRQRKRYS